MKQPRLRIIGGDQNDEEIELQVLPMTVGRGKDNDLKLPHPLVSRHHCRIFARDGGLAVEDLNSLNGTYVGSQKVEGCAALRPGDLLTIGTMTFRAIYGPAFDGEQGAEAVDALHGVSNREEETVDLGAGVTQFVSGREIRWSDVARTHRQQQDADGTSGGKTITSNS